MKAFVIKNENDYYYTLDEDGWDDEIFRAFITKDKELAEEIANECNKHKKEDEVSCQAVAITIYEGDLEKENRVLKRALELACGFVADEWYGTKMSFEAEEVGGFENFFIQQAKESKDE